MSPIRRSRSTSCPKWRATPNCATPSPTLSASAARTFRWSWAGSRCDGRMRALTLVADRKLELVELAPSPAAGAGEVQIRVKAVALNHIDVWGWRGMAFAKRKMPLVVGAEAAGEIAAVGADVSAFKPGDHVVMYGALTCGVCKACRDGRDNLCENVGGVMGFHVDGFARDLLNLPARLVIPVPPARSHRDAACP